MFKKHTTSNSHVPSQDTKEKDCSLANYRRSLIPQQCLVMENEKPQIEVNRMKIYENGKLIYSTPVKNQDLLFVLEQQKLYDVEVQFYVKKSLIYGLTISNSIYKSIIRLSKEEYKQGTFAPSLSIQTATFSIKTPGGILGRGSYRGEAYIKDNKQKSYCQIGYNVDIVKIGRL